MRFAYNREMKKDEHAVHMIDELPRTISLSCASALTGLSREAFYRHFILTGQVRYRSLKELMEWGDRRVIETGELGEALGREITAEDFDRADRKLQPRRDRMKTYRRRKESH
jgi:hypothetical protein